MPDGFGTVPDELRQTATKIADVIGEVAATVWQGPSADYGHAGVQSGYQLFIDDMKGYVTGLRDKADGHGQNLVTAAMSYLDGEAGVGSVLAKAGAPLESAGDSAAPATGFTGGATGFLHSSIAQRLNPGAGGPAAGDPGGASSGRAFF
ncbi:MAG: hypothetical protein ABW224_18640 [Kibdelosporangium sp.]